MSLLDGPHTVVLYPEVDGVDEDQNPVRVPDRDNPKIVYGDMQPTGSSPDDRDGQSVSSSYRLLCRQFPAGAWAVASWRGREFDVGGESRDRDESPGTAHSTVLLTARAPRPVS